MKVKVEPFFEGADWLAPEPNSTTFSDRKPAPVKVTGVPTGPDTGSMALMATIEVVRPCVAV